MKIRQKTFRKKQNTQGKSLPEALVLWLLCGSMIYFAQQCASHYVPERSSKISSGTRETEPGEDFRVLFYNVENLFDTRQDSLTRDEDFLPEGANRWTYTRYLNKLNHLFKVIAAAGGKKAPEIIGLCEIENRAVLEDLLLKTPLCQSGYKIIHRDSPDPRGIDVALLYRSAQFILLYQEFLPLLSEEGKILETREMLYAKGLLPNKDTLHVFVCHWPSKLNGARSEKLRNKAAGILTGKIDSIRQVCPLSNILIGGDFNDSPQSRTLVHSLQAKNLSLPEDSGFMSVNPFFLINLSVPDKNGTGTYSYRNQWDLIDQIIVSQPLTKRTGRTRISPEGYRIFKASFLLEQNEKALNARPFRTYRGPMYLGGYSDHLPVYLDLEFRE